MRVAALVKQIPAFEALALGPGGRLVREGLPLEMSAYCRRAVAEGVRLATLTGGSCTVVTLGPPSAEDVLREAVAFGADRGVLVSDPAFAGSDTLATARALAATLELEGPFDLVLVGRNSVDADTGQVGPQVAELLGLPFVTGVKELALVEGGAAVEVGLEHDDEWLDATVTAPAVLSVAERLIDPCKIKDPAVWATVDPSRLSRHTAASLGPGPWGAAASPTWVGATRVEAVERARLRLDGPTPEVVRELIGLLRDRGAWPPGRRRDVTAADAADREAVPGPGHPDGPVVAVVAEPGRRTLARELLAGAARLASEIDGRVVLLAPTGSQPSGAEAGSWGADQVVALVAPEGGPAPVEEDVARAVAGWAAAVRPWAVLAGGTAWGREVAARVAARLQAGLVGDAVGLGVDQGRLLAWKPAFGGGLVAAVGVSSPVQLATVRPGVLVAGEPRSGPAPAVDRLPLGAAGRVVVRSRRREDDLDALAHAEVVVGVGQGVAPQHYPELDGLLGLLGAELAATRKVTDQGWLPHARQLGITGLSISPRLYLALGTSGKFNHLVGVRSAGTIVAVNPDPSAPVFDASDIGIVGDWHDVVPELERQLREVAASAG